MSSHTKTISPKSALRIILILILISLTLLGVSYAYRYQQSISVCGDQFAASPERFSQEWWTCPREVNRHARVIGNVGNQDFVDVKFSTDNLRGWALSKDGRVFGTTNVGLQWTMLGKSEIGGRSAELRFDEDGLHGWIFGGSWAWAFGPGSTNLLTTDDGGKTWTPYKASDVISGLKDNSTGMVWAKDGERVWILGAQNTISHSKDAGKQWKRQFIGTKNDVLLDIAFDKEGKTGWAVGELRSILKTTDGGEHWQRIRNFPKKSDQGASANDYLRIYFSTVRVSGDGQQIWITGDDGEIIRSNDAGLHWYIQPTPYNRLRIIQVSDDGFHWWAIDNADYEFARLLETHDAGKTWLEKKTPANFVIRRVAIAKDNQHIWMVGSEGGIIASHDAGVNWTIQASQFSSNIFDVNIHTATGQSWFVSTKGLWRSLDNGDTWLLAIHDEVNTNQIEQLPLINFDVSGQTGLISGDWRKYSGQLLRTDNSGKTWQGFSPQSPPATEQEELFFSPFHPSSFLMSKDSQHIIIYDNERVFSSTDQGKSWKETQRKYAREERIQEFTTLGFCSVNYETELNGDIVTWKEQADLQTSHYCKFFEPLEKSKAQTNSHPQSPTLSHFPLRNVELQSTPEKRWDLYKKNELYPILWLSLTEDGNRGIAIGRNYEKIIASEDRGEHWREYTVPTTSLLYTVRYSSDEKQAWAVGEHNAMFMSEDNGKTWQAKGQYQRLPPPWFYVLGLSLCLMWLVFIIYKIRKHISIKREQS